MPASESVSATLPAIVPVTKLPRGDWRITADSVEPDEGDPRNAVDDDPETFWHTAWSQSNPPPPHTLTVELPREQALQGFEYLPRQGQSNGRIGRYELDVSRDGRSWTKVASGTFPNSASRQRVLFGSPVRGRFVRLRALSEVGGNAWSAVADLQLLAPVEAG